MPCLDIPQTDINFNKDIDMKTDVKRIVESAGSPNENDLWLNGTTLKKFQNGEWVDIAGGGSSGDEDVMKVNLGVTTSDVLDQLAEKEYFTIEAIENTTKVYFRCHVDNDGDDVELDIEVSTDKETWTEKTSSWAGGGTLLATLNAGEKLFIRGNNNTYGDKDDDNKPNGSSIYADKDFCAYGNMMSLINGDDALNGIVPNVGGYLFTQFFKGTKICSHPHKRLLLPKKYSTYCFFEMFMNCTKLTVAPNFEIKLNYPTAATRMFQGCTSLIMPPKVLYKGLGGWCFRNCTKLSKSPVLLDEDVSIFPDDFVGTNVKEFYIIGTTYSQYSSKDWTNHMPSESGVIYKNPEAEFWDEIKLPDGWVLKDVEIVYE